MSARPEASHYRPDIDGLRAVAVLAVVAYHAFPTVVTGGFVGVDVFFVISGYLITGIILKDLTAGTFSLGRFYGNRVRRIFPALSLLLLFCLGFGWLDLLVDEYHLLAKHIAGGTAFISNFILWKESVELGGYFDTAAELKPLLHLWSLGIEEQFYIVWPLLCMVALHQSNRGRIIVYAAGAIGIASFTANLLSIAQYPVMTFYFPGTRFWELMIGAGLAVYETKAHPRDTLRRFSCVGVALIAVATFAFTKSSAYPGWRALLPTLGAVLIILGTSKAWFNRKVLSQPLVVGVGLISYPLYLWHWPLLAFLRIDGQGTPSVFARLGAVTSSFLLAWLTYRFVERPLRFSQARWRPVIIRGLVGVMLVVGLSAKLIQRAELKGWLYSKDSALRPESLGLDVGLDQLINHECGLQVEDQKIVSFCYSDRRAPNTQVVYGDSRAHAIYSGLVHASSGWSLISEPGCPPLAGFKWYTGPGEKNRSTCARLNTAALESIAQNGGIKRVLLAIAARNVEDTEAVFAGLANTMTSLQNSGKEVVFLEDNPYLFDPKVCLRRLLSSPPSNCGITLEQHLTQYKTYYSMVNQLKAKFPNVRFYDPTPLLCQNENCPMIRDGKFLYSDRDHYSDFGSESVAEDLLRHL